MLPLSPKCLLYLNSVFIGPGAALPSLYFGFLKEEKTGRERQREREEGGRERTQDIKADVEDKPLILLTFISVFIKMGRPGCL